jgi:hypothetical protein
MKPYPAPGTIIFTPPPPPPADPAPAFTDEATPHFCPLPPKEPHQSPSLECFELLSNGGTHHAVRSSNAKEAELDDDAVAQAIIAIVDFLGSGKEVEQGRIGSALSKKERVVSLSLLTLFVCVSRGFVPGFILQNSISFVLYFTKDLAAPACLFLF